MKRDRLDFNAVLPQSAKQGPREMEASRRSGHGSLMLGIDRLIAPTIAAGDLASRGVGLMAFNIGWERDASSAHQPGVPVAPAAELDLACPAIVWCTQYRDPVALIEDHLGPRGQAL
jgi:hypothetical protein